MRTSSKGHDCQWTFVSHWHDARNATIVNVTHAPFEAYGLHELWQQCIAQRRRATDCPSMGAG